jgi:hypothetical protein
MWLKCSQKINLIKLIFIKSSNNKYKKFNIKNVLLKDNSKLNKITIFI